MKRYPDIHMERPMRKVVDFLLYAFAFIVLACASKDFRITLACGGLASLMTFRAIEIFGNAVLYRADFIEDEPVLQIHGPRL